MAWLFAVFCDSGQPIDGPMNGRAPQPWDIHCYPTQMFHDEVHLVEVPHTAEVTVSQTNVTEHVNMERLNSAVGKAVANHAEVRGSNRSEDVGKCLRHCTVANCINLYVYINL